MVPAWFAREPMTTSHCYSSLVSTLSGSGTHAHTGGVDSRDLREQPQPKEKWGSGEAMKKRQKHDAGESATEATKCHDAYNYMKDGYF